VSRVRYRFREDLEPQYVQIRMKSTAAVEVDVFLTRAQIIRLARAVEESPISANKGVPDWSKL